MEAAHTMRIENALRFEAAANCPCAETAVGVTAGEDLAVMLPGNRPQTLEVTHDVILYFG